MKQAIQRIRSALVAFSVSAAAAFLGAGTAPAPAWAHGSAGVSSGGGYAPFIMLGGIVLLALFFIFVGREKKD